MIAQFEVYGTPAPQGSKTPVIGRDNRLHVLEGKGPGRQKFKDWRADVKQAAEAWMLQNRFFEPLASPVHLYVVFRFLRPASYPKRKTKYGVERSLCADEWHITSPDGDKTLRAVCDALTASGLIRDDRYICGYHVFQIFVENGRPGATIGLRIPVEPHEFPFPLNTGDRHDIAS